MAERASAHMARGCVRRAFVSAIQPISPYRSASTNWASRADAGQGSMIGVKRQTPKPSWSAASLI